MSKTKLCAGKRSVSRMLILGLTLLAQFALSTCGIRYVLQNGADSRVEIIAVADKNLNRYQSRAHPLVIDIYQLKNLDQLRLLPKQIAFSELKQLMGEKISHLSLISQTLLPDSAKKFQISTQQSCRYLLILAGYYDLPRRDDYMAIFPLATYRRSILKIEYGKPILPEIYIRFGERKII